jgi:hypothetical protein
LVLVWIMMVWEEIYLISTRQLSDELEKI